METRRTVPLVAPQDCSLVRALDVIGERWTMLLLRQAFYGVTRFGDMQAQLGVSRKILAERLERMVESGLLARAPYRKAGQRTRYEYRLTEKGVDLATALIALMQWADRHMPHPDGRPLRVLDRTNGQEIRAALMREDGQEVRETSALTTQRWPDRKRSPD